MSRIMSKQLEAEASRYEADVMNKEGDKVRHKAGDLKGSPLQSKINSFTNGKPIKEVRDIVVGPLVARTLTSKSRETGEETSRDSEVYDANLLYEVYDEDEVPEGTERVFSKVLEAPLTADLQKKINAFSGGKDISVQSAFLRQFVGSTDSTILAVLFYTKPGVLYNQGGKDEAEATEPAPEAEPAAA